MTTVASKIFRSGNSEAVRLPKEVAFGADMDVLVTRIGDEVRIRPKPRLTPAELVERLRAIGFPTDGVQPRPEFEYPDRPGLFD